MEARLVPLPSPANPLATSVRIDGERIVVDRLTLHDPSLAAYVSERPADDRPALVERALKIGLTAPQPSQMVKLAEPVIGSPPRGEKVYAAHSAETN